MTVRKVTTIVAGVSLVALLALSFVPRTASPSKPTPEPPPEPVHTGKVAWVDSYHQGYAWSDGIERGMRAGILGTNVELKVIRLDMKHQPDEESSIASALAAKAELDAWRPDVIIASDDPAQKYLVVPYYRGKSTPIVFCGVNWSATEYGYPTTNVTGMVEVDLVRPLIEHLRRYAPGSKVAYFAVDDLTERKLYAEQNKRFFNGTMLSFLAPEQTFAGYCETFLKAQEAADIILICNNAGIKDWNDHAAEEFFRTHTTKPTGTINTWLPAYAMVTFSKLPEEQGEWAMQAALKILDGTKPSDIPLTENRKGRLTINLDIAERLNVVFPADILKNAEVYQPAPH